MKSILLFISLCTSMICFSQEKVDTFFLKTKYSDGTVYLEDTITKFYLPFYYVSVLKSEPITGIVISSDKNNNSKSYSKVLEGYPVHNWLVFKKQTSNYYQNLQTMDYLSIKKWRKGKLLIIAHYLEYGNNGSQKISLKVKGSKDKGVKVIRTYYHNGQKVVEKEKLNLNDFFKEISPLFSEFSTSIKEQLGLASAPK